MSSDSHLSDERYLAVLERLRARIVYGGELTAEDCTAVGQKENSCSWGLCDTSVDTWPGPEDRMPDTKLPFALRLIRNQRHNQLCPLDNQKRRRKSEYGPVGCFWRCRIFGGREGLVLTPLTEVKLTREEAVGLYDQAIARVRARILRRQEGTGQGTTGG